MLGGLTFGQDEEGNWGYIPAGADAVTPFKSGVGYAIGGVVYKDAPDVPELWSSVVFTPHPKTIVATSCSLLDKEPNVRD